MSFLVLHTKVSDEVLHGVRTLLKNQRTLSTNQQSTFWYLHRGKTEVYTESLDLMRGPKQSKSENDYLDKLQQDLMFACKLAAERLESLPPKAWQSDKYMLKTLVFSNIVSYMAVWGQGTFKEQWKAYEDVCQRLADGL